jgi:hypothetical protein
MVCAARHLHVMGSALTPTAAVLTHACVMMQAQSWTLRMKVGKPPCKLVRHSDGSVHRPSKCSGRHDVLRLPPGRQQRTYPRRPEGVRLLKSEEAQPSLTGVWLRQHRLAKLAARFCAAVRCVAR